MNVLITGGAGYIGSALAAELLKRKNHVTVLDNLTYGCDSLMPLMRLDGFQLLQRDLCRPDVLIDVMQNIDSVVHLAAIVGFPACRKAGRQRVLQVNVDATARIHEAASAACVDRLIFASSYSNYGESTTPEPVTEESPLYPKSLYAESKILAEQALLSAAKTSATKPICLRLATLFGLSPRPRFDLMVNQFVLEAYAHKALIVYEKNFRRSFVHVRDVVRAIIFSLNAPLELIQGEVFNIGSEKLNTSKEELITLIKAYLPDISISHADASFAEDMRNIHVSFNKIRERLGFEATVTLGQGIEELVSALRSGQISDPFHEKYRNHPALLT
jgi:nucleoside-diphosphate-sugar epimerase